MNYEPVFNQPNAILISDVSIRMGSRDILKNVNASIKSGEFIGIFGPNGAGKSTLMKALLGLIPVHTGVISIFGKTPKIASQKVGYMPQLLTIPERTGLSSRSLIMAVQQGKDWGLPWNKVAAQSEVDEVLELANARDYSEARFSTLSGGEKQRIILAQALLGKPRLLLLDEPLAGLDPHHQVQLIKCLKKIKERTGTTILFIAHDINPLLGVMDRILYVAGGSAALGTVDEIISDKKLSELYNTEMQVAKINGHLFIIHAESGALEKTTCQGCC
ncbi:MAG: metal ABC transporter ATP-binding protein [Chthoniobacterales bacterium]